MDYSMQCSVLADTLLPSSFLHSPVVSIQVYYAFMLFLFS